MKSPLLRRFAALLFALTALIVPANATWSIVTINMRTGEVGVASATCITSLNLRAATPVILIGKGAAACQSLIDLGAINRMTIYDALGTTNATPSEILDLLRPDAAFQARQYGILAFTGGPVTFTGRGAGNAATGVTGVIDDYVYAIQGNVLTDDSVVYAAEQSFRDTAGDMSQRLMASMEAARALGGDGRCSCSNQRPTSCGAPPPNFTKSAHVGFLMVARYGDTDGACESTTGCASGKYYLAINIARQNAQASSPDPVTQMRAIYDVWRGARVGRSDGILSTVDSVQALPADGITQRTVTIQMVDIDGNPLTGSGQTITVSTEDGGPSLATVGPVVGIGGGKYQFTLTAGTTAGTDTFVITVPSGFQRKATLYPYLTVRTDPAQGLHAGYDQVSASSSPTVPLVLNVPDQGGSKYVILATLNGTQPASSAADFLFPLNPPLISVLRAGADTTRLPRTIGVVPDGGRIEAAFVPSPSVLLPLIGSRIDWAAVMFSPGARVSTAPVGFDIVP